jgi:hypothetical protein
MTNPALNQSQFQKKAKPGKAADGTPYAKGRECAACGRSGCTPGKNCPAMGY